MTEEKSQSQVREWKEGETLEDLAVGNVAKFMKENQAVQLTSDETSVLSVELPSHVNLRVTHTEPGVRGDTATNVLKPATVETGTIIQVPIFVNEGDMLRIDTRNGEYVERVKE